MGASWEIATLNLMMTKKEKLVSKVEVTRTLETGNNVTLKF